MGLEDFTDAQRRTKAARGTEERGLSGAFWFARAEAVIIRSRSGRGGGAARRTARGAQAALCPPRGSPLMVNASRWSRRRDPRPPPRAGQNRGARRLRRSELRAPPFPAPSVPSVRRCHGPPGAAAAAAAGGGGGGAGADLQRGRRRGDRRRGRPVEARRLPSGRQGEQRGGGAVGVVRLPRAGRALVPVPLPAGFVAAARALRGAAAGGQR